MLGTAKLKTSFSMVQWHGEEYPYYQEDADSFTFLEGEEVLVLKEVIPNPMGRLFVVYSERINDASIVAEQYLDFIDMRSLN